MKTSKSTKPKLTFIEREDAEEGTIGFIFDYYRKQGKTIPQNAEINADKFKAQNKLTFSINLNTSKNE